MFDLLVRAARDNMVIQRFISIHFFTCIDTMIYIDTLFHVIISHTRNTRDTLSDAIPFDTCHVIMIRDASTCGQGRQTVIGSKCHSGRSDSGNILRSRYENLLSVRQSRTGKRNSHR